MKEGDELTIVAYKTSYKGLVEGVGYYFSHKAAEQFFRKLIVDSGLNSTWGSTLFFCLILLKVCVIEGKPLPLPLGKRFACNEKIS